MSRQGGGPLNLQPLLVVILCHYVAIYVPSSLSKLEALSIPDAHAVLFHIHIH